jgi:ABC-type phosphate transport system auxiliary subunit
MRGVDVAAEYKLLTDQLELGVGSDNYGEVLHATDEAAKRLHRASVLYQRIRLDVETEIANIESQLHVLVQEGRKEFADQLAKNASEERVLALVQTIPAHAGQIEELTRRRREAESGKRVFEALETAWAQRCRHLDTMLGRVAR